MGGDRGKESEEWVWVVVFAGVELRILLYRQDGVVIVDADADGDRRESWGGRAEETMDGKMPVSQLEWAVGGEQDRWMYSYARSERQGRKNVHGWAGRH